MSDPVRLLKGGDQATVRLLESAAHDRPSPVASRATLVALGLAAPAAAATVAVAPVAAASKGVFSTIVGKVAIAMTAAAVASGTVIAVAPVVRARTPRTAPAAVRAPIVVAQVAPAAPSGLAAEGALLRQVTEALSQHDAARALAALDEHAARFPAAQLDEEAGALRVEALAQSGDEAAAGRALAAFRDRFPDSPYAPVIKTPAPGDVTPQAMDGRARRGETR